MGKKDRDPSIPAIELIDLWKELGGRPILRGVNLRVMPGETMVVIGGSGTGKSVSLKHIMGLMVADKGKVLVFGEEVRPDRPQTLAKIRQNLGVLFQGAALLNWLSVFENVALPLRELTKEPENRIRERVEDKLSALGLIHAANQFPSSISGGMRKRVGLARALVMEPDVILYDEPTSGLDPVVAAMVNEMIVETQQRYGVASICVTHDMVSAYEIADRITMLYQGQVIHNGTPDETKATTNPIVRQFIEGRVGGPIVTGPAGLGGDLRAIEHERAASDAFESQAISSAELVSASREQLEKAASESWSAIRPVSDSQLEDESAPAVASESAPMPSQSADFSVGSESEPDLDLSEMKTERMTVVPRNAPPPRRRGVAGPPDALESDTSSAMGDALDVSSSESFDVSSGAVSADERIAGAASDPGSESETHDDLPTTSDGALPISEAGEESETSDALAPDASASGASASASEPLAMHSEDGLGEDSEDERPPIESPEFLPAAREAERAAATRKLGKSDELAVGDLSSGESIAPDSWSDDAVASGSFGSGENLAALESSEGYDASDSAEELDSDELLESDEPSRPNGHGSADGRKK